MGAHKIIDIDTISTVIAAISVIIGVFFAVLELRNLAKQKNTDFLYKLQSSMTDESYRKAWKKNQRQQMQYLRRMQREM